MAKAIEKATAIVPNFAERGSIGLRRWGGQLDEEFLAEWKGANRYKIIDQMRKNSPVVAAMLRVMTWILTSAKWTIEPDTPASNEPADFVQSCLDDLEQTWSEYLSEVLTFLPYGFSLHEVVNYRRPDGKIGWKRFGFRAQETVSEWKFDDRGYATGFFQSAPPEYKRVEIPLAKCIHMRLTTEKANPEGDSVLRAAYRPFYFGKNLEEVEAIGTERDLTGIPVIYLGEGCTMEGTNSHYALAKDLVRNIRMDEQMGVVLPLPKLGTTPDGRGILLELLASGGSKEFDTSAIITRYETRMAMSVLAQWLMLGMNSVGSYALSDDQSDFFRLGLEGTIRIIEEQFTRQAIRRLLAMNPGIEGTPRLVGRLSVAPDYSKFANAINQLVTAQVLDPTDANVRTAVMDAMGMPHPVQLGPGESEEEDKEEPEPPDDGKVEKGGSGSGNFGHTGRPGEVGGSVGGAGLAGLGGDDITDAAEKKLGIRWNSEKDPHSDAGYAERKAAKAEIVRQLGESGIEADFAQAVINTWSVSSQDGDPDALRLQVAASQHFGVPLNDYLEKHIRANNVTNLTDYHVGEDNPDHVRILQAMYGNTQQAFKKAGFKPTDTITIYRGVGKVMYGKAKKGDSVSITGNPLESWSLHPPTATYFAREHKGRVFRAKVPISRIVATSRTGVGCLAESEIVIQGAEPLPAYLIEDWG